MWEVVEPVIVGIIVATAVAIVILKVIRLVRQKGSSSCSCGCSSCPSSKNCNKAENAGGGKLSDKHKMDSLPEEHQ